MRPPRMTTRRLMIAIAVLAIGLGAISWVARMRARSADYRRRAREFYWMTRRNGSWVRTGDGRWVDRFEDENDWRGDDWALRLEAKYLELSHYPWRDAEPDPRPPRPLDQPRRAVDLPERDHSLAVSVHARRPPAWTFPWTWGRQ